MAMSQHLRPLVPGSPGFRNAQKYCKFQETPAAGCLEVGTPRKLPLTASTAKKRTGYDENISSLTMDEVPRKLCDGVRASTITRDFKKAKMLPHPSSMRTCVEEIKLLRRSNRRKHTSSGSEEMSRALEADGSDRKSHTL